MRNSTIHGWNILVLILRNPKTFKDGYGAGRMNIDLIRANAHPVENGDLDAFIERWGFPFYAEIKYDGERCWLLKEGKFGNIMWAFNKHNSVYNEITHGYLFDQYRNIGDSFLLEGELCSKNGGIYSYLHNRHDGKDLIFYSFDVLELNGVNLRDKPLEERKNILKRISPVNCIYSILNNKRELDNGAKNPIKFGYEGVVIKSPKQKYGEGYWLKIKREETIDCAILGIRKTKSFGQNRARSYRLGLYNNPTFTFIGDVGSGLKHYEQEALQMVLETIKTEEDKDYLYTQPKIVLEITAESKSENGHLIHPRIRRIRTDKSAEDCDINQLNRLAVKK